MEILFYTDMHMHSTLHLCDADGHGMHVGTALAMLHAIQRYADEAGIIHIINGGDSVNFTPDTELYTQQTEQYDGLIAEFHGSSSSSLGNHDFHDLLQRFISATARSSNVMSLENLDLITLQPRTRKDSVLTLNFDYHYEEFEGLVDQSTSDNLVVSSHWAFDRYKRMDLKEKPYAFTSDTPEFVVKLASLAQQGKKVINLSGHEHSYHYSVRPYQTLVMPSAIQDDVADASNPCGLFAVLKVDENGISIEYKKVVMGARLKEIGQPLSIDVNDVSLSNMQQYSRQALMPLKHGALQP